MKILYATILSAAMFVARGGLCRFDMSPKLAYNVIRDLFGREWRTDFEREVSGGRLSFRGFYGTYEIEATSNGKTVTKAIEVMPDGRMEQTVAI